MNRGLVDEPVFAFRLGRTPGDEGEATFGGIDSTAYKGNITYAPVRRRAYWEVAVTKLSFGDKVIPLRNTGAAIDTGMSISVNISPSSVLMRTPSGTSFLVLPTAIANALNARIGAKQSPDGDFIVNCNAVPTFPVLTFYLNGQPYPLQGTDYILNDNGTCVSTFSAMDGSDTWIIGECIRQHRVARVASAHGCPLQATSSSVAITQCTISVATPLDSPNPPKFFDFVFTHSTLPRNGKYHCTMAIPSLLLFLLCYKSSERNVDLTRWGT